MRTHQYQCLCLGDIGRIKSNNGWTPIQYEETNTNKSWMTERLNPKKPKITRSRSHGPYKPGPRDIGKISDSNWKPIKLSKKEQNKLNAGSFLDDRPRSRSASRNKQAKPNKCKIYKAGPRDIGRNDDNFKWKPIELSKEEEAKLNEGAFLDDMRLRRSKSAIQHRSNIFKPGPRMLCCLMYVYISL